ncbi:MAG: acyl-CoA dehydrogenase family protein [Betaproteobacteria bacterium]|nr:acyl-CoA dehydrogenase family protein [Betaproteobacteria bacterium]
MNWSTHDVGNMVEPLADYNRYATDPALREGAQREGAAWADAALLAIGADLGRTALLEQARLANACGPVLRNFDPQGRRVDAVDFHPAWHNVMAGIFQRGFHSTAWAEPRTGAQVARAAGYLLQGQVEAGTLCPTTMTFASIPILRREPVLWAQLEPHLFSRDYDPADAPLAAKRGMLVGMGLTEKQGGSDLRTNTTLARPLGMGGRGAEYALVGHKWFFSVPQSDAHLVLARDASDALSCFYVPRWRPDATRNAVRVQRLKDKLGNRSNASAEVEFQDAWGLLVGEPGRGIPILLDMATYTRLDNVLGSTALLRAALVQAMHHARQRSAFGKHLAEQPLMQAVLADLALETEAATTLALRLAAAFDRDANAPPQATAELPPGGTLLPPFPLQLEAAMRRILTPAAKLWVCKRAIEAVGECMEVLGGNGYVEEQPLARMLREAPVNSIWEGSGNVMALDLLRALQREPQAAQALQDWLTDACQGDAALTRALAALDALRIEALRHPAQARALAQDLVLLVQAVLLRQHAPAFVADAFIASRLGCSRAGRIYGVLPQGVDLPAILQRAWAGD